MWWYYRYPLSCDRMLPYRVGGGGVSSCRMGGSSSPSYCASSSSSSSFTTNNAFTITTINNKTKSPTKRNQPSQEIISMCLRAEKETTGGRRRFAADLYKWHRIPVKPGFRSDQRVRIRWIPGRYGYFNGWSLIKNALRVSLANIWRKHLQ